ncbi:hypothetical protein CC1G_13028 [Coprinopsis cinerea okayama7|uniref:ATP-dependent DNA helicase n=1 Tax=Coprinopsis cinerea (strain Okayama-7 / 130 / ATCC MYA-4618 / FGSC 9003) TaxID=240176 RepID=A8PGU7_COPC7|nr:hypothetical protein CC1G_13028 [Coprinopsis cinerea okayama7\|eukprot:XP_001841285.2 hypothetical protein CC1G_13028 [Coprinopsis cinerea okayama7\
MAGTGKTQVLKSLIAFFKARGEPYRLVLLGPTGTSAALIGGTTYHSFLSIVSGKWGSNRGELRAVEEVRERLLGLPPTKGHALYSGDVSLKQSPRQKVEDQQETIGKSIWCKFTCCVILKKNMRQREGTEDDMKFRMALENLRYRACTNDDIAFLKTRIPAYNANISLDDPKFRVDSLCQTQSNDEFQSDEVGSSKVDPRLQVILWDQVPSTSEQVPARLSLCIGMPVMVRSNEATELCITRGQEAIVVGWKSTPIKGFPRHNSLDTLFVRLVNPPKRIKIPGLPEMVVPLTKTTQQVTAKLPNGETPKISRRQIPVLPNFSMTDYASQGKTRALPDEVVKPTRWATIDAYKKWSKDNVEADWHPVLRSEPRKDEWQRPIIIVGIPGDSIVNGTG